MPLEPSSVALRDYLEQKIGALQILVNERDARYASQFVAAEKAVNTALASAQEAVRKAETSTEKRFDSVNEFRSALSDQTKSFLPRSEYDSRHTDLERRIGKLEEANAARSGVDTTVLQERQQRNVASGQNLYIVAFVI